MTDVTEAPFFAEYCCLWCRTTKRRHNLSESYKIRVWKLYIKNVILKKCYHS